MKAKKTMEVVRGSGNAFADFGYTNAAAEQLKALLAAQIIKVLDRQALTVRAAAAQTGIDAGDFSRVRKVKLDRFTIERLMDILERLDQRVEVKVKFKAHAHDRQLAPA